MVCRGTACKSLWRPLSRALSCSSAGRDTVRLRRLLSNADTALLTASGFGRLAMPPVRLGCILAARDARSLQLLPRTSLSPCTDWLTSLYYLVSPVIQCQCSCRYPVFLSVFSVPVRIQRSSPYPVVFLSVSSVPVHIQCPCQFQWSRLPEVCVHPPVFRVPTCPWCRESAGLPLLVYYSFAFCIVTLLFRSRLLLVVGLLVLRGISCLVPYLVPLFVFRPLHFVVLRSLYLRCSLF